MPLLRPVLSALFCAVFLGPFGGPTAHADEPLELSPDVVVDPSELEALLAEGRELMDDEEYVQAGLRFSDVIDNGDPDWPVVHRANFELGVALYELELWQSALLYFEAITDVGPDHPDYASALPYLLGIAQATTGDANVQAKLAEYPPELYPEDLSGELHFLVGQYFYSQSSFTDALHRFQKVEQDAGEYYVRAKYLEGVIHVQESRLATDPANADAQRLGQAADSFKAVLRHERDEGGGEAVEEVAAKATLALGRLFFSTRQYNVAVRYYDQIDEQNAGWLQAVFEVSWVYFQLKNYPRALGNLHTLNSPFFEDQYFPESRVLQALILFYNCRYDEANAVIKAFVQEYYPLMQELKEQVNQFADPNAFYFWLAKLSRAEETEFSTRFTRIFNAALADRKLRRKFYFVKSLNDELDRLNALAEDDPVAEPFLSGLKAEITAYRSLVVGEAGSLAQARLLRVLKELKRHLAGALKIKGETLKAARGVLPDTLRAEQKAAAAARPDIRVDAEHIEWPFTGEYWRDELGSYLYDISSRCEFRATGQ
ncbi:MAG: tetratricopeptide repeat protein [Myxococcota bacterium]